VVSGAPGVRSATLAGRVYAFHGGPAGLATRPSRVTTDGRPAFGEVVTGLGDVDGDGYDDVLASWEADPALTTEVYVLRGAASSLGPAPDAQLLASGANEMGRGPQYVADLDGDGRADVVTVGAGLLVYFAGRDLGPSTWPAAGTLLAPSGRGAVQSFGREVAGLGAR
jgi:hypothetical protein